MLIKVQEETEKKSVYSHHTISNIVSSTFGSSLSNSQAFWLWSKVDTIGGACDLIAWAFGQLEPVLKYKKTNEIVIEHPFLSLLKTPSYRMSSERFKFELMTNYLISNECYPVLEGNTKFEPFEIYSVSGKGSSLVEGKDGLLNQIILSQNSYSETFWREEIKGRGLWVYQNSSNLRETIQITNKLQPQGLRGQSVLERVYYDSLVHYWGNIHNVNMLKNATRPSGLWSPNEELSQDGFESFKTEITHSLTGPTNSGKSIISPVPVNYKDLILNPRDMDFLKLIETSAKKIYGQYQIPLPLVLSETMTMGNYSHSIEAFYDLSLMPRAKFLYKSLGDFVLPRYKDGNEFEVVINEKEIDALKGRLVNRLKEMRSSYVFSENEIRTEAGYESIGEEGNKIWKPANLIPAETDTYTDDNISVEG